MGEKFVLLTYICNLVLDFLATDYKSFAQNPGTQGQKMRPSKLKKYRSVV